MYFYSQGTIIWYQLKYDIKTVYIVYQRHKNMLFMSLCKCFMATSGDVLLKPVVGGKGGLNGE